MTLILIKPKHLNMILKPRVSTNAFHSATPTRPSVDEKSSSAECSCASQLGIAVQSPGSCPSPSDQHFPCSAKRLRQGGRVEQIPPENLKQWLVVSIYHMVTSTVHFVIGVAMRLYLPMRITIRIYLLIIRTNRMDPQLHGHP